MLDQVVQQCGVWTVAEFSALIEDDSDAADFLKRCRAAAAQPPPPVVAAPAVNVTLQVTMPPPPPPPPPTVNVVLQVAVPAVPTATVGIVTDSFAKRNAQAQTPRSFSVGVTMETQTETTALSMVTASTSTESAPAVTDASTHPMVSALLGFGVSNSSAQTDADNRVAAADYEQLGAAFKATVEEAEQASQALATKTEELAGLLVAIIRRKRIDMDGVRYNVWCEGEVDGLAAPQHGAYVVPFVPRF